MTKLFTKQVEKTLDKFPYGSQDGKGKDAIVIARFFIGPATWYILEKEDDDILYGLANLGYGFEYGSVSRRDLETLVHPLGLGVERDFSVEPGKMTLGECMAMYGEEL